MMQMISIMVTQTVEEAENGDVEVSDDISEQMLFCELYPRVWYEEPRGTPKWIRA